MTKAVVLGWSEWVSLPAWGVDTLRSKIDTGAKTSAIHVETIELLPDDRLRFELVHRERPKRRVRWIEAELVRHTSVKRSDGRVEERPVVRTRMRLGPLDRDIEVSLVSRSSMRCRMLVGRTALQGALVDPRESHLVTPQSRAEARKALS